MKKYISIIPLLLVVIYLLGPTLKSGPVDRTLPTIECGIDSIELYVQQYEDQFNTREGCRSEIVWADSVATQSEYALLYLHGFSASHREGAPIHYDVMSEFGMNGYLARLADHGLSDDDALLNMTPARLYESAKEALVVASKLGQKVVVMGCSTGCTLALMLAADFPESVEALILYSPNVRIKQCFAPILSAPWGLQITRLVHGGEYSLSESEDMGEFWDYRYRLEAQVYLQQLLDLSMTRWCFEQVTQPIFMGYYYKNEQEQDPTISVKAALQMFDQLSTPSDKKEAVSFPEAGSHVINCDLRSNSIEQVREATFDFIHNVIMP